MPNNPLFPQSYPGPGQFVILCEGDAIGYEAAILGRWLRNEPPASFLVDVRPCGTGDGLFGTADAIGRTVRVVVVEDRDFRSNEVSQMHCAEQLAERNSRDLAMRGWLSWSRNEVENFFLDHEVLFPAMKDAFECAEDDVKCSLDLAVQSLILFQAVQAAVAASGAAWETLSNRQHAGGGRPKWGNGIMKVPNAIVVRKDLEQHVTTTQKKVCQDGAFLEPILGKTILHTFDENFSTWSKTALTDVDWKRNWAGKEVLKLVRQDLARQFRPPIASANDRIEPVVWGSGVGRSAEIKERDDQLDRDIERAIQPVLIKHLFQFLEANPKEDLANDFHRVRACFDF